MPKLGVNETIAIIAGLVIVAGFFLFLNPSTAVPIPSDGVATALQDLQDIQRAIQGNAVTELIVEDIVIGTGREAALGDTLSVHYVGVLTDGTRFDSSLDRGIPFEFTLGTGQVISGWDQGLVGIKEGGRRILVIPPRLGYGENGTGSIPPNSVLIFEVLLVEITTEG